jgi:hypothetical protein
MARPAMGPDLVNKLSGSEEAKVRLKVILETVGGSRTIESACQELGIGRSRFFELRDRVLQAAVADLEAKPRGRPAEKPDPEALKQRLEELQAEQEHLFDELQIAHVREEIRLVMPQYVVDWEEGEQPPEKKTPPAQKLTRNQRKRQRRRGR